MPFPPLFFPFHIHQCTIPRLARLGAGTEAALGMCSSIPEVSASASQVTKLQHSHSPASWGCSQPLFHRGLCLQAFPGISGVLAFRVMSTGRRFAASQGEVSGVLKGAEGGVGRKGSCSQPPPDSSEVT